MTQTASEADPAQSDKLSGRIDLARLFEQRDLARQDAVLRGADLAHEQEVYCVVSGAPRFAGQPELGAAAGCLAAWRQYGAAMPAHLTGGYAVVIVDARQGSVLLAVDRFAIHTLCYRLEDHQLSFSDRADQVAGRGEDLDPQALFDYLFFHMIPAPRTIFRQVQRLPAAHSLLIRRDGAQLSRHWPLQFTETQPAFPVARDQFRQLIRDAVRSEIAGHSRIGCFLSGGTDSSTVAGMLGEVSGTPARAYSIGFEAEGYDEMAYARIAAQHFGCQHHEYYVTPADLLASIPAVAAHHDQPFGNSSALPAYYCARLAHADGCSKLLAGDGGDELFGGNTRYAVQKLLEPYQALPQGLRRRIEPLCSDDSLLRRLPLFRQATGYVRHSKTPLPDRLQANNLLIQLDPARVLTPQLLAQTDVAAPVDHMRLTWQACASPSLINRMLAYDWRYTLADSDLPKVRGATEMAGIAVGFPLLADALTDFSMQLPADWKVRRFKLRWFFKQALRGFLPEAIIHKKKQGFGLPFGVWTHRTPALHKLASDSLHSLADRGIVQRAFVERLMTELLATHPGYYGEMVWILMSLEQWLQARAGRYRL